MMVLCQTIFLCLVHCAFGGLFARYNENGSTSSVKMMRVNMVLWAMDHPPPTKMYMISNLQDGAFKDVVHQLHAWRYDILVADIFFAYFFFSLFLEQSHQQLKCSATTIMVT